MLPLMNSIKRTNHELEAIENKESFGIIVVEDEKVYLRELDSNDEILTITDEHKIDVLNCDKRYRITRKDILTIKDKHTNGSLFSGLEAFVK